MDKLIIETRPEVPGVLVHTIVDEGKPEPVEILPDDMYTVTEALETAAVSAESGAYFKHEIEFDYYEEENEKG